jgi:DNA-binding CsgD family transcriptional regulator
MMMTSYLYKNGKQSNSYFFMKSLLHQGLGCYAIALGSKLTIDTVVDVIHNKNLELDILSFKYLLGYYCFIIKVNKSIQNKKIKNIYSQDAVKQSALFQALCKQPWQYLKVSNKRFKVRGPQQQQSHLTLREQQVLYFLLQGVPRAECAFYLDISPRTIEFHWHNIRNRLKLYTLDDLWMAWQPLDNS